MFTKNYEFRYSDLDKSRNIKISILVDILQDISIFHSHVVGLDLETLHTESLAWLLEGWRIRFEKPFNPYKTVVAKTGIMKLGRCDAVRKYEVFQENELKIKATAIWYTVNMDKRKIVRVPEGVADYYESVSEEDNNLPYIKLKPDNEAVFMGNTKVEQRDIDTNNHMNNVKSLEAALEFLPEDFNATELKIKYLKELRKGEIISVYRNEKENSFYFDLRNENGDVCVIVNIEKE